MRILHAIVLLPAFFLAASTGAQEPPALAKALLDLAGEVTPGFDSAASVAQFEKLCEEAKIRLDPKDAPAAALDKIHRWLAKEKRWVVEPDPLGSSWDCLFLSGVLRDGRGAQPSVALVSYLIASRSGLPVRLTSLPDRLLLAVDSGDEILYWDPAREPPFLKASELMKETPPPSGARASDLLCPLEPGQTIAYLRARIGMRSVRMGDARRARDLLSKALTQAPRPEILYAYGTSLLEAGDLTAAQDVFSPMSQNPSFFQARALAQLARIQIARGAPEAAQRSLASAEKLAAPDPVISWTKGLLYESRRRWTEAAQEYETAVAAEPFRMELREAANRALTLRALERTLGSASSPPGDRDAAGPDRVLDLVRGTLSQDPKVGPYCLGKLQRLGDQALPPLKTLLAHGETEIREQVVLLLPAVLSDRRARALFAQALRDPAVQVRLAAIQTVARVNARSAAQDLRRILAEPADNPEELLKQAAYAFLSMGPGKAPFCAPHIARDARAEDPKIRARAYRFLGEAGGDAALAALRGGLGDPDPESRSSAAEALGKLGEWTAVGDLIATLNDPNSGVRSTSARALEHLTHQQFGEDGAKWDEWWKSRNAGGSH